jgi:hypothetical protein
MKLLEVAPDFVRSEVGTFMTILQMLQSKVKAGTKVPTRNIVNLMNNAGYSFDWKAIEGLKEKYPAIGELISDADEDYITVGGGEEEEPEIPPPDENDTMSDLDMPEPTPMQEPMGAQAPLPSEPAPVDIGDGRNPERALVNKMAARAARF